MVQLSAVSTATDPYMTPMETEMKRKIASFDTVDPADNTLSMSLIASPPTDFAPLSAYDDSYLLPRMVSSVNVATAFRDTAIHFVGMKNRHSRVTPETVARILRCGLETAKNTLQSTTQRGVRHAIHPLHRRYQVDHLNLNRRRLNDTFYMDTLFSKVTLMNGNVCAQLITNGKFTRV
jgi:hypothetical protein